jgi:uncharacterized protein YkwD
MVVGVVRIGAQRASLQQRLSVVVAGTFFATVFGFAVAATSPAPAQAYTPPFYSVELYYLSLVNCTRTGGWVLSDGSCKGYGSGRYSAYVAPLKLSAGLSNVSRVWAKKLSLATACKHGDPASRLRASGYTSGTWGENIGCGDGYKNAHNAILWSHLRFQDEKASGGGHWRNIKNSRFKWIGIGVWKDSGRIRLVTDFYSW